MISQKGSRGVTCWGAQLSPQAWSCLPMPGAVLAASRGWQARQLSPMGMPGAGWAGGSHWAGVPSNGCPKKPVSASQRGSPASRVG